MRRTQHQTKDGRRIVRTPLPASHSTITRYLLLRCLVLADHDVFQRVVHAQMRTHLMIGDFELPAHDKPGYDLERRGIQISIQQRLRGKSPLRVADRAIASKSAGEDLEQVAVIPAGLEAFGFDPAPGRGLVLQERQRNAPQQGQVVAACPVRTSSSPTCCA
jgi:hypothetical protein